MGNDDGTQWVRVAVFGAEAEALAINLRKGDRVYVEGRLSLRRGRKTAAHKLG